MPNNKPYLKSNSEFPYLSKEAYIALESLEYYTKEDGTAMSVSDLGETDSQARSFAFGLGVDKDSYLNCRDCKGRWTESRWKNHVLPQLNAYLKSKGYTELDKNMTRAEYNEMVLAEVEKGNDGMYTLKSDAGGTVKAIFDYSRGSIKSNHTAGEAFDIESEGDMHKWLRTEQGQKWLSDNHIWADYHAGHVHLSFGGDYENGGNLNAGGSGSTSDKGGLSKLASGGNAPTITYTEGVASDYKYTKQPTDDTKYDKVEATAGNDNFADDAGDHFDKNSTEVEYNGSTITTFDNDSTDSSTASSSEVRKTLNEERDTNESLGRGRITNEEFSETINVNTPEIRDHAKAMLKQDYNIEEGSANYEDKVNLYAQKIVDAGGVEAYKEEYEANKKAQEEELAVLRDELMNEDYTIEEVDSELQEKRNEWLEEEQKELDLMVQEFEEEDVPEPPIKPKRRDYPLFGPEYKDAMDQYKKDLKEWEDLENEKKNYHQRLTDQGYSEEDIKVALDILDEQEDDELREDLLNNPDSLKQEIENERTHRELEESIETDSEIVSEKPKSPNRFDYPLDPNVKSKGKVNPDTEGISYNEAQEKYKKDLEIYNKQQEETPEAEVTPEEVVEETTEETVEETTEETPVAESTEEEKPKKEKESKKPTPPNPLEYNMLDRDKPNKKGVSYNQAFKKYEQDLKEFEKFGGPQPTEFKDWDEFYDVMGYDDLPEGEKITVGGVEYTTGKEGSMYVTGESGGEQVTDERYEAFDEDDLPSIPMNAETLDGGTYTGEVDGEGRPHGMGKFVFDDGDVYVGTFKNGDFQVGKYTDSQTGEVRSGRWNDDDTFEGEITRSDGTIEKGRFTDVPDKNNTQSNYRIIKGEHDSWDAFNEARQSGEQNKVEVGESVIIDNVEYILSEEGFEMASRNNDAVTEKGEYNYNSEGVPVINGSLNPDEHALTDIDPNVFGRDGKTDVNSVIVKNYDGRSYLHTWDEDSESWVMDREDKQAYDIRRGNVLSDKTQDNNKIINETKQSILDDKTHEQDIKKIKRDVKKDLREKLGRKKYKEAKRDGTLDVMIDEMVNQRSQNPKQIGATINGVEGVWTGKVDENGNPDGKGVFEGSDGNNYSGYVEDGTFSGEGTLYNTEDGSTFTGTFDKTGPLNGTLTRPNGSTYTGDFKTSNGTTSLIKGRKEDEFGKKYEGEWNPGNNLLTPDNEYKVTINEDGSVVANDIIAQNKRNKELLDKGKERTDRINEKISNGSLTLNVKKEYSSFEELNVIDQGFEEGDIIKVGDQYYKMSVGGNIGGDWTLWDIENDIAFENYNEFGIDINDIPGDDITWTAEEHNGWLDNKLKENQEINKNLKKESNLQLKGHLKKLKKLKYNEEYINIYNENYNGTVTSEMNPYQVGSDEAKKWEEKLKDTNWLWDNNRKEFIPTANYGNDKGAGIGARESNPESIDNIIRNYDNPHELGKSRSENRKYRKWEEQVTKKGEDGSYLYDWDPNQNKFTAFRGDQSNFADIGWKSGTYTNQNGDLIRIDKNGRGFIQKKLSEDNEGNIEYGDPTEFTPYDQTYLEGDFQRAKDPKAFFNQPENVSNLVAGIVGIGGLAAAMKKIDKKDMPELSEAFDQRLRQSKELSKQGFDPAEEAMIRQDINQTYLMGIDNLVRGTAGDRAKFLASTGILDANRNTALLQFAAADVQQKRENQKVYTDLLSYKENFEAQKTLTERQEDLDVQLNNKAAGAELAATAFGSIRDSVNNAGMDKLMKQYMKKLEDGMVNVNIGGDNAFAGLTTDTDGDGVMDAYDSNPNDPNVPNATEEVE